MDGVASWGRQIGPRTWAGVRRFPLALAAAVTGSAAGCVMLASHARQDEAPLTLLLASWLGVALTLTAALVAERAGTRARKLALHALAIVGVAACFAGLRHQSEDWLFMRFFAWLLAAHALLALAPLPSRGDFREFNLLLFARTTTALVFTHVLFVGIAIAMEATKRLFDVRIEEHRFGQLWLVLMGVVNTAYVLAGIPRDWDRLRGRIEPPKVVDALARHALLPLSGLYLVLLYAYSVKIVIVRDWPRGWVSVPIIAFAVVGLLTVLLLDPERRATSRFARAYCRGFFFALLPLVVLLVLAVYRRTSQYGLTEARVALYAIAAFLAMVGAIFVLAREPKLPAIPAVLAALAIVLSVGPLSARSLSVQSQLGRLREALIATGRLDGGGLVRATGTPAADQEARIGSVLAFLERRGAMARVLAWRSRDPQRCPACASLPASPTPVQVATALGLTYRPWAGAVESDDETTLYVDEEAGVVDVAGFDWVIPELSCWSSRERCTEPHLRRWDVRLGDAELIIERDGRRVGAIPLTAMVDRAASTPQTEGKVSASVLRVEGEWAGGRYRLALTRLQVARRRSGESRVASLHGALLIAGMQSGTP